MIEKITMFKYFTVLAAGVFAMSHLPIAYAQTDDVLTVYRSPSCGCCGKWAVHMLENGFKVKIKDTSGLHAMKRKFGIPADKQACHTAVIGDHIIEGHVPAGDVKALLADPGNIKILAVPGMPVGSPGMEGDFKQDYPVYAIDKAGQISVYAEH